jgi:YidC/Oxa1 family membrane protein insertase
LQELDRNSIIGFVLMGLLMVGYLTWQGQQSAKQQVLEQARLDSLDQLSLERTQDSLLRASKREAELIELAGAVSQQNVSSVQSIDDATLESLSKLVNSKRRLDKFGAFANQAHGEEQNFTISNDFLKVDFSNRGGKVISANLKDYKDFRGDELILFEPEDIDFGYRFFHGTDKRLETDSLIAEAIPDSDGKGIRFRFNAGPDQWFDQIYRLSETAHVLDYRIELHNFDRVIPANQPYLELNWNAKMRRQENNIKWERQMSKAYVRFADGDLDYKQRDGALELDGKVNWISYVDQFFNATLIAKENFSRGGKVTVNKFDDDDTSYTKAYKTSAFIELPSTSDFGFDMQFVFAPNDYPALKAMDNDLQKVVPVGRSIIGWCNTKLIIPMFNLLNKNIANYGLIILILTGIIKLALTPLTYRSYLSMAKMRVLKPEMDALKEKYGDDQQAMSKQTMQLYQQTGVNPLGGCLPMVFQMPILFAMYRFFPNSIELRQQSFLWADDLSTYDSIMQLPFDIPFYGDHVSLFTLLAGITSLAYARLNSQMTAGPTGNQMQMMQYIFPVMMLFIFNSFSSALTYYYLLQNVFSFGQQYIMKQFFIDEDALRAQIHEKKSKPKKKSSWAKRFEAYADSQQQAVNAKKKESQKAKKKK